MQDSGRFYKEEMANLRFNKPKLAATLNQSVLARAIAGILVAALSAAIYAHVANDIAGRKMKERLHSKGCNGGTKQERLASAIVIKPV